MNMLFSMCTCKSIERVTGAGRLTALAVATIQRSDQPASCPEVIALATSSEFFLTPSLCLQVSMCRITVRGGILTASAISLAVLPRPTSGRISLSRAVNGETSTSPAYQQRGGFTTVSLPELERPGLPIQETGPAESLCDNRPPRQDYR